MNQAKLNSYHDLSVGTEYVREYTITARVYEEFLRLFGDASPLHVDAAYAKACGFSGVLMHGAILNGFISNFVGMFFPGGRGMELSVDIRFLQPVYLGDVLRLQGKIAQKLDVHQVVVVHFGFLNLTKSETAATARVQIKMMAN